MRKDRACCAVFFYAVFFMSLIFYIREFNGNRVPGGYEQDVISVLVTLTD